MGRIKEIIEKNFPVPLIEEEGKLMISYGAMNSMEVWITDKKLCVNTTANPGASEEEILDTNKKFRFFLDQVTGYSSKQRVKMAKQEAQE